jgi:hypothetical protein
MCAQICMSEMKEQISVSSYLWRHNCSKIMYKMVPKSKSCYDDTVWEYIHKNPLQCYVIFICAFQRLNLNEVLEFTHISLCEYSVLAVCHSRPYSLSSIHLRNSSFQTVWIYGHKIFFSLQIYQHFSLSDESLVTNFTFYTNSL